MLFNPNQPTTQSTCRHCGKAIPIGDRRPQEFCSDAHRKAFGRANFRTRPLSSYRPENLNAPTVKSAEIGAEKANNFKGRISGQNVPSVPLNLLGGASWSGAGSAERAALIKTVIDMEIGTRAAVVISPDGVAATIIRSRSAS